jgi:hypothetical protein
MEKEEVPPPSDPGDDALLPEYEDPVDCWGADSFPASDPPQWWAGRLE